MKGTELFIDFTFSNTLSVLLSEDDRIKRFFSVSGSEYKSSFLSPLVRECMRGKDFSSLSGIYIAKGPGSFTALRILISYVKGIHIATSVPIYTYNSTDWMALYLSKNRKTGKRFTIGMYSGAKDFYYVSIYEIKDHIPELIESKVQRGNKGIDFEDTDIEKELGAKYLFYLHTEKTAEKPDITKLQPNYLFSSVLQIT